MYWRGRTGGLSDRRKADGGAGNELTAASTKRLTRHTIHDRRFLMTKESSAHGRRTIFPAVLIAAIVSLLFVTIADAQNQKFQFGVIGDTSYSKVAEQEF